MVQVISASRSERIAPFTGLEPGPVRTRRIDAVAVMDSTLAPTRDHRSAAPATNYRYPGNVQIAVDADTRLVITTGDAHPGNRNGCTVYRDSGIVQELARHPVITDGSDLPGRQEDLNAGHHTIRARIEHAPARMKCWKTPRDYRRAASTLDDTVSDIAHLHNIPRTN
ncbi:hypothetical protein GCM10022222_34790 [Amycolatopsis ultiminotia]|uniref:DDE superfamily endonuclease n=1 Tax=Amycolatopsis ultiminotia TaxID=543629 RepID=A0ABP6WEE4_9PSEU